MESTHSGGRHSKFLFSPYNQFHTDDTQSMAALTGAMVALIHHPHVQARAQAEIDLIVGRDRLPNFTDMDELPYISAICREVMRWRLVTPLAVGHAALEDDVYEGYFIPKGKLMVINILVPGSDFGGMDRFYRRWKCMVCIDCASQVIFSSTNT